MTRLNAMGLPIPPPSDARASTIEWFEAVARLAAALSISTDALFAACRASETHVINDRRVATQDRRAP